jgi:hypothetical protein
LVIPPRTLGGEEFLVAGWYHANILNTMYGGYSLGIVVRGKKYRPGLFCDLTFDYTFAVEGIKRRRGMEERKSNVPFLL